jgi:hypothetical protein
MVKGMVTLAKGIAIAVNGTTVLRFAVSVFFSSALGFLL